MSERIKTKDRVFTTQLPATPCTEAMRQQIIARAKEKGVHVAQIQREAFSLFLATYVSSTNENAS